MTTRQATEDEVLRLLRARQAGDASAEASLFALLYQELRGMAAKRFLTERRDHTLMPTSLVHEAFLRLEGAGLSCADKDEYLRLVATVMRRVLIDSARRRRLREPHANEQPMSEVVQMDDRELAALDAALCQLDVEDPGLARLVDLRYLVGLDVKETARALRCSTAKVVRDWRTARAFLQCEITRYE